MRMQELPNLVACIVSIKKDCYRMAGITRLLQPQTFHFGWFGRIMAQRDEEKNEASLREQT